MRKTFTALVAALVAGGAVAATAVPAEARPHGGRGYYNGYYNGHRHHDHDNDAGVAVAAGVIGLALGAALASSYDNDRGYYNRGYYDRGYYDRGYSRPYYGNGYYSRPYYGGSYYGRPYGYPSGYHRSYPAYNRGYGYRTCTSRNWVYDPYIGRRVMVKQRYAC